MSGLREIALDTETTGTAQRADRIIEVGCVELVDRMPTGRTFHRYCNPAPRRVHPGAYAVHGLSDDFLADKPAFEDVADELFAFLGDARLIIHNAPFDVGMLNFEFSLLLDPPPPLEVDAVLDTMKEARRKLAGRDGKGKSWSLNALAAHFKVNAAARSKFHGALVDAEILAGCYRGLFPPEQQGLTLELAGPAEAAPAEPAARPAFRSRLTDAERARHAAFVAGLGAGALWNEYISEGDDG